MMQPRITARLERRILINYRVDEQVAARLIPAPFRPLTVAGYAIAGICLIRLGDFRPLGVPAVARFTAENAAHRFAVLWDTADGPRSGVWIPRRDTSSSLIALAGGRLFPGWHHRASFDVAEEDDRYSLAMTSEDGEVTIRVSGEVCDQVPVGSVFGNLATASRFYRCAPAGYSARRDAAGFDGVELSCRDWNLMPLAIGEISSSYFSDGRRFPPGSITLDSAFLMRDLDTTWSALPAMAPVRRRSPRPARPGRPARRPHAA